ncbi:MAG: hypothetical protein V7637_4876, partial [Mycobacteriales bacterium]
LVSESLAQGHGDQRAVSDMLRACSGSMAIAVQSERSGGDVHLAVKGSGQSLFVGFTPAGYLVASEIYGLVGQTQRFVRVDGTASGGTVLRLTRAGGGRPEAVEAWDATGTALPPIGDPQVSYVTSRDLARGDYAHYLDKELHDAPESFRRTLRGRIDVRSPRPAVSLPESSLPEAIRRRITEGGIRNVVVVGQGTAAVAAQGVAHVIGSTVGNRLTVTALPATEFSAWRLVPDMTDTLVVAISQSGSTTDTNRAVDMARARGCGVLAIVNRRDSDLAHKSSGVLYTSDGRDVELSVASTKAFYAQVAAGSLLAVELGRLVGALAPEDEGALLEALLALPGQLATLLAATGTIRDIAGAVATRYPNWSVVGSGPNRVAANEIRIKLSELCYKAVAVDAVEDKKHIDLSAEALVLVCVAGAPPGQISDLVKEVEILAAHGNRPVVLCDEGTEQTWPTDLAIGLPPANPELAWIITTAAGHLFAYHAALCIDRAADEVRAALAELEKAVDHGLLPSAELPSEVLVPVAGTLAAAARGELRGVLTSQTAMELAQLVLRPRSGGPVYEVFPDQSSEAVSLARAVLTRAIDELGRPIDSVKHQAKTVTVGTSRVDADLYDNDVVVAMQAAGLDRHALTLPVLRVVRAHARLVEQVAGVTRYQVRSGDAGPSIEVVHKTGLAANMASRADRMTPLVGSKRRIADLRVPRLLRGRRDGRVVFVVPEQEAGELSHLALVHVRLREHCTADELVAAMNSVGDRMADIVAAVTETTPSFVPDRFAELSTEEVLLAPVEWVAEQLTTS